jgi:hypothetical protein
MRRPHSLAEALRSAGIEVWFDREELRGGDAWDQKIRQQIRDCRLFVPIVSANTEARLEGYFRREWKLAVDRTDDMASEVAFLVPVVIDDTPNASAHVPGFSGMCRLAPTFVKAAAAVAPAVTGDEYGPPGGKFIVYSRTPSGEARLLPAAESRATSNCDSGLSGARLRGS